MNEFETQLEKCRKLLYDEPIVKEYFRLKKIVMKLDNSQKVGITEA